MDIKYRVVDLKELIPLFGLIVLGEDTELKLLEYYKYPQLENESTIKKYTNYVINRLNHDNIEHPFIDILKFFKEKDYNNKVMFFLHTLTGILFRSIDTDFTIIRFNKIEEYDKLNNILNVKFEVQYGI